MSSINRKLDSLNKKVDLYGMQLYACEGESDDAARLRFFRSMPEAAGQLALYQAVNTKLLSELIRLMAANGLDWWMWSGSLIAAASRGKAIPWDDDIDICMMREDFEELRRILRENPDYQLSVLYAYHAKNRTYRFVSRNEKIFNFIDIVPCDWVSVASPEKDHAYKEIHQKLIRKFETDPALRYWRKRGCLYEKGMIQHVGYLVGEPDYETSGREMERIDSLYNEAFSSARKIGILCEKDSAVAIAYGLDNMFDKPWRQDLWQRDKILPTRTVPYEDISVRVPADADYLAQICFPGAPYVPEDISLHPHTQPGDESAYIAAMKAYFQKKEMD